jgi:hypothetical protein
VRDRWKKLEALLPLAPYLALLAALLVAALAVTYYRWRAEIRRAAQAELLNRQQAEEIVALRGAAARSEAQAAAREGRIQELVAEVAKKEAISRQLSDNLEKLKAEAAAEQARIAAVPAPELAAELENRLGETKSEGAARKIRATIADRDACREQEVVKDQQLQICRESMIDYAAIGEQQALQIQSLKQALDLEKRAFEQRDDLAKSQVNAAKGSWLGRTLGKAKWFVIGVGVGAVAGAAAAR